MLNGGADCEEETVFLERGGGRGGIVRKGLRSCDGSTWIVRPPPAVGLVSSEAEGFPVFLTGSGGGEERILSPFQSCELSVVSDWWVISTAFDSGWMD